MAARTRQQSLIALGGGLVAGIFGGIVLSLYGLLASVALGVDPWTNFKVASAPFLGDRAFAAGFDASAVGLGILVHFAVSALWGALFGLVVYGASAGATLALGAVFGLLVWVVMTSALLPALGLTELGRTVTLGPPILEHVVFGLAVGVGFLPFQRRSRIFY
jgi:hypothetical protein